MSDYFSRHEQISCKAAHCVYFPGVLGGAVWVVWVVLDFQSPGKSSTNISTDAVQQRLKSLEESLNYVKHDLAKAISDNLWFQRLNDIADVDKVRFPGPPSRVTNNPTAQNAGLELIISAYTFVPKKTGLNGAKLPLLVYVHGGVHGDVHPSGDLHLIREMVEQGYAVIAPDYRGSSGYGGEFWKQIDYGGLEIEDVFAAKQWMLENHTNIDRERVGILGWSHGGLITLMNLFDHPKDFRAGYAGVPVSDLVARMGYKGQGYRDEFSAATHLGKTADENVKEYRKRSPVAHAQKLQAPLLIHTTTNDEDVNVLEVEGLINALKAAGKQFEYHIYTNAPGGHAFNRLDTQLARESRNEIWKFLAKYLNPANPPR
jgi:dipeptidyl aminopeptidase/acylaminoacyl peptidase